MYRTRSHFTKQSLALAALATLFALAIGTSGQAATIYLAGDTPTMDQLENNAGELIIGDKRFHGFTYTPNNDMPAPTGVTVQGIVVGNSVVLQFSGAFHDDPGGAPSDAGLGFNVEVLDPNRSIKQVTLAGTLMTQGDDAEVHIDELISSLPPGPPTVMSIERKVVGGVESPFNQSQDMLDFQSLFGVPGFQSFRVTKDIFADAGSATFNSARVTTFIQEFVQVPEPATMALAGLSGLAMAAAARRRRRF